LEFGKHLAKGFWGLADKALPVVYGIGYVLLVIRVLPSTEFGNFVLIQEIFLVISGLATGLALQPLLKFSAERSGDDRHIIGATMILYTAFLVFSSIVLVGLRVPLSDLLNASDLRVLLLYIPAMIAASYFRNVALALLQARFLFARVFWVDAVHFLGAPLLIVTFTWMHIFHSAFDLILVNIISLSASSVVGLMLSRSMFSMTLPPRRDIFNKIWVYGKYSLGGVTSYLVYSKADTFLLSAFTGPVQVAVYNSVKVFVRVFEMAAQVVQMFVLPAASKLSSDGDTGSLRALTEKAILFSTVGMLPVTIVFLVFPGLLTDILYDGRYSEAIPILQIFALLTFIVPATAVGSNVLMGLGMARETFILGLQMFASSAVAYLICIPWLETTGAALGYVAASVLMAWLTVSKMNRSVPVTLSGVLGRSRDIRTFLERRLFL
jgi:O-antigen/teichoic acid export membrane protein